jgi:hypothetical protein
MALTVALGLAPPGDAFSNLLLGFILVSVSTRLDNLDQLHSFVS